MNNLVDWLTVSWILFLTFIVVVGPTIAFAGAIYLAMVR